MSAIRRATSAAPVRFASNAPASACRVPMRARSSSSSTGTEIAPGSVVVGELGRAARVEAVGVRGERLEADEPRPRPRLRPLARFGGRGRASRLSTRGEGRRRGGFVHRRGSSRSIAGQALSSSFGCASAVGWMRSGWNQRGVVAEALEEERDERRAAGLRGVDEHRLELARVRGTVVRRQPHADEEHARTGGLRRRDHRVEVRARARDRAAAQAVVAAELDHDDGRLVPGEQRGQARTSAGGGVAADARVHDAMRLAARLEACLQQVGPAAARRQAVGGGDRVADDEQDRRVGGERRRDERGRRARAMPSASDLRRRGAWGPRFMATL